ncbi:MAG TPA: energy-coupling factor transporter ATPase, partial [Spirochaetia bacterium]|nr:energy-coupling factor transporter ATPase [Spirochaetia bacterium]
PVSRHHRLRAVGTVSLVEVDNLEHSYSPLISDAPWALRGISFAVEAGEYLCLVGANGSGKSTLALHLNGLLLPTRGSVAIEGMRTDRQGNLPLIRKSVAMVFQRPEDQIVALTVEEDVAFGPENLGLQRDEIRARVSRSLSRVGLSGLELRSPHRLSAGQKQRLSIAGVLATEPRLIVFDEATSMLDPKGRGEVLSLMAELNRTGLTIVHITHRMEEAALAGRMIVLDGGRIVHDGPPRRVFSVASPLIDRLGRPPALQLAQRLGELDGPDLGLPMSYRELSRSVLSLVPAGLLPRRPVANESCRSAASDRLSPVEGRRIIEIKDLSHSYERGGNNGSGNGIMLSLKGVSLAVREGECLALIGSTGSGKSTFLQHMNGLFVPQHGSVEVDGIPIRDDEKGLPALRRRVGLVFQRPEEQIFAQYVGDEVAYGPRLAGLGGKALTERVRWAMELVGLPFDAYKDRISFALSGGEQRKVGLAGVIALEPKVLLLDEPSVGLDPASRRQILEVLERLKDGGTTILLCSHDMEEVARLADRTVVLSGGAVVLEAATSLVFERGDMLRSAGLDQPESVAFAEFLAKQGVAVESPITEDGLARALLSLLAPIEGRSGT